MGNVFLKHVNQQVMNHAKAGAFYTDLSHCRRIAAQLKIDDEKTIYALDPSIGDAGAILTALDRKNHPNLKVYGCELQRNAAEETSKNPLVETCLCGDYLKDLRVSHGGFDVIFANPPYGMMPDGKERMETEFFKKINLQFRSGGVLIWVIPRVLFEDTLHNNLIMKQYHIERMYRFDDKEYAKYHQVVLILRRDLVHSSSKASLSKYADEDEVKKLPYLPETCPEGERIPVTAAPTLRLKEFKLIKVDRVRAYEALFAHEKNSGVEGLFVKPYEEKQSITVPKMPSSDSIYMMMAGGVGGGICGDDLHRHMQRGRVTQNSVNSWTPIKSDDPKDRRGKVTVRTFHSATITVIQANGTISRLTGEEPASEGDEEE